MQSFQDLPAWSQGTSHSWHINVFNQELPESRCPESLQRFQYVGLIN